MKKAKANAGSYFLPLSQLVDDEYEYEYDNDNDDREDDETSCHINRLPDELLFLIFNKLVDAKWLCRCNLVSKRFSSIVPQIRCLSLTIPPRYSLISHNHHHHHHQQQQQHGNKFVSFLFNTVFFRPFRFVQLTIASKCLHRQFNGPLFRAAIDSLKQFPNIQKLHIELPPVQRQDSLVKWHAEFGNDMNICIILFATSFRKLVPAAADEDHQDELDNEARSLSEESSSMLHENDHELTDSLLRARIASANQCFSEASWRNHIVRHMVEEHPSLERVQVTDSNGDGRLLLREKHGDDEDEDKYQLELQQGYAKVWHFQVMELPISGYVMEGVSVFAIRHTQVGADGDEERLNSLMDGAFEDDFYVYNEILKHRYQNHVTPITLNLNVR